MHRFRKIIFKIRFSYKIEWLCRKAIKYILFMTGYKDDLFISIILSDSLCKFHAVIVWHLNIQKNQTCLADQLRRTILCTRKSKDAFNMMSFKSMFQFF